MGIGTGSNLTVSISPFGLVELSDEEFEVHGIRLNRYATSWAFYLGMHWSYRREMGEPEVTFNYYRAFTDYLATFTFGRGVQFKSPRATSAIVPSRLKRIWEQDNDKRVVLWEMAQQGGVSGDVFVKVAYEDPTEPTADHPVPPSQQRGRVRILVLNPSHVFPEWHPHDRERMLRCKITYKFWGQAPEGTRQVFTYSEILTEDIIEEYINDQIIRQTPNPLGVIPIVHIPNARISGSPWGLPDCYDIRDLNRFYNEMSTQIADIVNYHASPITVVTGAKIPQLEAGAKKVWAIPNENAKVQNLNLESNLAGPNDFLNRIKAAMHEMVGVPESALGQAQPISNTSGVALSIQFQPLMQKWHAKANNYAAGLEKINEFALMTLFLKEPDAVTYDPTVDGPINPEEQQLAVDPADPLTYITEAHFPSPLPIDKLILLNELQMKQSMGLESRVGMLEALGEEFPDEKLEEIRAELIADAKSDGALQLLRTLISKQIVDLTGMVPGADGAQLPPTTPGDPGADGSMGIPQPQTPQPIIDPAQALEGDIEQNIRTDLLTQAYGTKLPQRRTPDEKVEGDTTADD